MLSVVGNRCDQRILADVLDHDPTQDDLRALLRRGPTAFSARNLPLLGVTTDGSARYPASLAEVFGDVPYPICMLYLLAEIHKAV